MLAECRLERVSSSSNNDDFSTAWQVGVDKAWFKLGEWLPCQSPVAYAGLDPGAWEFSVRLYSLDGKAVGKVAKTDFTVHLDDDKLYARIIDGPYGPIDTTDAVYTLRAVQGPRGDHVARTAFTCTLAEADRGKAVATSGGIDECVFKGIGEGEYTVTAEIGDGRKAATEQLAVFPLRVDTTAPSVKVAGPHFSTRWADQDVTFVVKATEPVTFECSFSTVEDHTQASELSHNYAPCYGAIKEGGDTIEVEYAGLSTSEWF